MAADDDSPTAPPSPTSPADQISALPPSPATPRRGRPPSGGRKAILAAALELLRERGASRLTTKEIAVRAGVSEGSVFYHFTDRTGLMTAVIEDGLSAMQSIGERGLGDDGQSDGGVQKTLDRFTAGVEALLDRVLVVMIAAQSDAELRSGVADYLIGNDLGPHRGVQALGDYLRSEQVKGTIRDDADPQAVAFLLISSCFMRAGLHQMVGPAYGTDLPGRDVLLAAMETMLKPI